MATSYYRGVIDHEAINDVLRGHRYHMSYSEAQYLKHVRGHIHNHLKGDLDNVTVNIHLQDSLRYPIQVTSGDGDNVLDIYIGGYDGIRYEWTYRTLWRRTKDFLSSAANGILGAFKSAFGGAMGFVKRLAIGW